MSAMYCVTLNTLNRPVNANDMQLIVKAKMSFCWNIMIILLAGIIRKIWRMQKSMMPPVILNQTPLFWPLKSPFCPKMSLCWNIMIGILCGSVNCQKNMLIAKKV